MPYIDLNGKVGEAKTWATKTEMIQDKKIQSLEQLAKDARAVIEFYGDKDNWVAPGALSNHRYEMPEDKEDFELASGYNEYYAGKRARAWLEKYKERSE